MWIEPLANGKFKYVERYTDPVTGKDKRVSITHTKNTNIAKKEMQRLLTDKIKLKTQANTDTSKKTFNDIADEWFAVYEKTVKVSSALSMQSNLTKLKSIFGPFNFSKLTLAQFNKFFLDAVHEHGKSHTTISVQKSILTRIIKHALKYHNIDKTNLIPLLELPKTTKTNNDFKYLEKYELEMIVNYFKEKNKDEYKRMILLQTSTGMRYNEMVALDYEHHIDFENNSILIERTYLANAYSFDLPKNNKVRTIYFNNDIKQLLLEQIQYAENKKTQYKLKSTLLFSTSGGKPIQVQNFNKELRKVPFSDKKLTTHIFRHTFITLAVERGIDKTLIAKQVGHTDTTMIEKVYAHFTETMTARQKETMINFKII